MLERVMLQVASDVAFSHGLTVYLSAMSKLQFSTAFDRWVQAYLVSRRKFYDTVPADRLVNDLGFEDHEEMQDWLQSPLTRTAEVMLKIRFPLVDPREDTANGSCMVFMYNANVRPTRTRRGQPALYIETHRWLRDSEAPEVSEKKVYSEDM